MIIDDYNGDNFDHGGLGFVGGGDMGMWQTNARPIQTRPVPAGTPQWGAQWKKATAETFNRAMSLGDTGSSYSYRDCFLDLDPTYKDRLGRPLMRMTFDFHDNELKMSAYLTDRLAEIARALDPVEITPSPRKGPYTLKPIRPRTTPAAPSWAPIPQPACSTAIARAGMFTTSLFRAALRCFRRTTATIRPIRSGRLLTGPPMPSRIAI